MKNHIKRISMPNTWDIKKKENKYSVRPNPGKRLEFSLPLGMIIRDFLHLAANMKEAKYLLQNKNITVSGVKIKDFRHPVMLMDTVEIVDLDERHRMMLNSKGKLWLKQVAKDEPLLYKVIGKKTLKNGKTQLNLFDGTNILSDKKEIKTGDVLVLDEKKKIKEHLQLEKGCSICLIGGRHTGTIAKVLEVKKDTVLFKTDSAEFETRKEYAFIIGKDKPLISV